MSEKTTYEHPELYCRSASVHFIYSFTLTSAEGNMLFPKDLATADSHLKPGTPAERKTSISPHLALKSTSAWRRESAAPVPGQIGDLRASLQTLVRLFPSGGVCTFCVRAGSPASAGSPEQQDRRLRASDVRSILKLVDSPLKPLYFTADGETEKQRTLYGRFHDVVTGLASDLKGEWMDAKYLDDKDCDGQNPWVVTVLEVDETAADAFCGSGDSGDDPARTKMMRLRKYERVVAPILFRSVAQDLIFEPAYVQPPTPIGIPGLFSVNLDARLFVCMSRRSILCICESQEDNPASYFVPSLLDICEMVRARWNSLVLLNTYLDECLRSLLLASLAPSKRARIVESTRSFRFRLATCLEDPSMYIVAGDALSKIQSDLSQVFRTDSLKEGLLQKMKILDQLYEDSLELEWLPVRDRAMKETGKDS